MDTNVTSITKNHLIAVFAVRLQTQHVTYYDAFRVCSTFYDKQNLNTGLLVTN